MIPIITTWPIAPAPPLPESIDPVQRQALFLLDDAPNLSAAELSAWLGMSVFEARCAIAFHRGRCA